MDHIQQVSMEHEGMPDVIAKPFDKDSAVLRQMMSFLGFILLWRVLRLVCDWVKCHISSSGICDPEMSDTA